MDTDKIIESLNSKNNIVDIGTANFNDKDLTEAEKEFIKTHQVEKTLIIYGTLAPGKPNHHIIEHIKGKWERATIKGRLQKAGWGVDYGYLAFKHVPANEEEIINAIILFSDELPANWQMLDEFEGEEYRRIISKYELENGETGAGYIYAASERLNHNP